MLSARLCLLLFYGGWKPPGKCLSSILIYAQKAYELPFPAVLQIPAYTSLRFRLLPITSDTSEIVTNAFGSMAETMFFIFAT